MKTIIPLFSLAILFVGLTSMNIEKRGFNAPKNYVYIPSGNLEIDKKTTSIQGFFMSKYEITNNEYNQFLNDLKSQNRTADYEIAKHQNENWLADAENDYLEPIAKLYHVHSSYGEYPVVTITKAGADLFCEWKAKQLQNKIGENYSITVRLPVKEEWMRAAKGGYSDAKYGWNSNATKDKKDRYFGNFKTELDIAFKLTTPVDAYNANEYGLYNMSGNVAEWTSSAYYENAYSFLHDLNPDIRYDATDEDYEADQRKVIRGGSWKDVAYFLRCGVRHWEYQDTTKSYVGFRCALTFLGRSINDDF